MASTQDSYPDGTYVDHTDPASKWANLTPSDATVYDGTVKFRSLWVSVPATASPAQITLVGHDDTSCVFTLQPGFFGILPFKPKKIMSTGTTAGIEFRRLF